MPKTLFLFGEPHSGNTQNALTLLQSRLHGYHVKEMSCYYPISNGFALPFIRDEDGIPYFGMEGIDFFISKHGS